ncbi:MAG TPA: hypothetical protein VH394_02380 [Thermoanaerobaculia bacterium]|jgi:Tol biopolymer transport system component|nr:hypothetical protein [Thermoanaerobaculia bacterium]
MVRAVRHLAAIGFLFLAAALAANTVQAGPIELLSKAGDESDTATGYGYPSVSRPTVSDDGRWIVYSSNGTNLVPGQTGGYDNLFLHDRQTGTTALITHASGSPTVPASRGNVFTGDRSISDDGRWIVYASTARNLVDSQVSQPWIYQVFLYDRETGVNTLVSHSIQGDSSGANDLADAPRISGDGNWIVYESAATDLLAGQSDAPGTRDVFLQERATGQRILVSHATGTPLTAANHSWGQETQPSVSDDGRWVAFQSSATNLIPGFTPPYSNGNVYLFDRATDAMTLVSHTSASATSGAGGRQPLISPDGAAVLFSSLAGNIVPGQIESPESSVDLFLFDRASGTNVLVSHTESSTVTSSGGVRDDEDDSDIAAGGAWVVFNKFIGTIGTQVYLFRRADSTVTLLSRSAASPTQPANSDSARPRITPDGAFVIFSSGATNLVPGQSTYAYNVFLYDNAADTLALVSGANGSGQVGGNGTSYLATVSDDGSTVAYATGATNLDAGTADLNGIDDVAVYDRASADSAYVTLHAPGQASATASGGSVVISASADGRYAVFFGSAVNAVPGQKDGYGPDIFLADRVAGTTALVSHAAGQPATSGGSASVNAAISADGNYVAFASTATNLVPGQIDTNYTEDYYGFVYPGTDIFLYNRATGATVLVSHTADSSVTAGDDVCLSYVSISADGRYVAFACYASNLVPGQIDLNEQVDIFLYDRASDTTTLVSRKSSSALTAANNHSFDPVISGDGRWIGFRSLATNLVTGSSDGNAKTDVFLYDRILGKTLLVSRAAGTAATAANQESLALTLNPDGRYGVFSSSATNLVPGQAGPAAQNVFLFDRVTGTVELISRAAGTATTGTSGTEGSVSADGRYVIFRSAAPNLVPGQTAGPAGAKLNVFVHDRVTRQMELISRSFVSPLQTSNGDAGKPALSQDGRYMAFLSHATDIAAGATGHDIYLADRQLRTLERVAEGTLSEFYPTWWAPSSIPYLSADGSVLLFTSSAPYLAGADFNAVDDVFAWTRSGPGTGDFFTVAPCRLIDTRQAGKGPALASGVPVLVEVLGRCGIPGTARAVAINVTAVQAQGAGSLTLHPGNLSTPNTNTINFQAGQNLANNAILPLASNGEGTLGITPTVSGGGTVHVIVDISGWFE